MNWTELITAASISLMSGGAGLLVHAVLKSPELPVTHQSLFAIEDELETRPLTRTP